MSYGPLFCYFFDLIQLKQSNYHFSYFSFHILPVINKKLHQSLSVSVFSSFVCKYLQMATTTDYTQVFGLFSLLNCTHRRSTILHLTLESYRINLN